MCRQPALTEVRHVALHRAGHILVLEKMNSEGEGKSEGWVRVTQEVRHSHNLGFWNKVFGEYAWGGGI